MQDIGRNRVAAFEKAALKPDVVDATGSSAVDVGIENPKLDPRSGYGRLSLLQEAAHELLEDVKAYEQFNLKGGMSSKVGLDALIAKTTALRIGLGELDASLTVAEFTDKELIEQIERIREIEVNQSAENARHLVTLSQTMPEYAPKQRQVMGWTIHTRSSLNEQPVSGPPEFTKPDDEWTVEYVIDELPADNVDALYDACVHRKSLAGFNAKTDKAVEGYYRSPFFRDLEAWSDKGARWRRERDALDEEMGPPVVFEDSWGKGDGRVFADGMGVKDVDEYVEWLYQGGKE
jgi:hypothetical protein